MVITDFRHHLKRQTQPHHDRVDRSVSQMDVSERDGLIRFLRVHKTCFAAMVDVAETPSVGCAYLHEMIASIKTDLGRLAPPCGDLPMPTLKRPDPLALDYMVEGSRLGSQVLGRRWAASTDAQVLNANSYFSLKPTAGRWKDVCHQLSLIPIESARAAQITSDTQDLFDMFDQVSRAQPAGIHPTLETTQ